MKTIDGIDFVSHGETGLQGAAMAGLVLQQERHQPRCEWQGQ
ncbi:MAG: hypothetical protein ABGX87_13760 [Alcanivorax sp.]